MSHPEQPTQAPQHSREHAPQHARQEHAGEMQNWMNDLDPIVTQMTDDRLMALNDLNRDVENDYSSTFDNVLRARELMLMEDGHDERTARRMAREIIDDQYERQLQRLVLEQHNDQIQALLTEFSGHLDPNDPNYDAQMDDVYNAIYTVAGIPRQEWTGDRDENGDFVGNGFFHEVWDEYHPEQAGGITDDEPDDGPNNPAPVSTPPAPHTSAVGRARVVPPSAPVTPAAPRPPLAPPPAPMSPRPPQILRPPQGLRQPIAPQGPERRRPLDSRESVVAERYGVKIGDRMAFTHKLPNGTEVMINYRVAGFPAQLGNEANPPVMLQRTEQYFDQNGQAISAPNWSRYAFSGEQLKHLGRDAKEFQKSKGKAVELGTYWETIDKREKREHIKENIKVIFGAAALAAVNFELQRRGQDLNGLGHGIGHAFNSIRDMFGFSGNHASIRDIVHAPGTGSAPGVETFGGVDITHMTPNQHHAYEILTGNIGSGEGGLKLYDQLGLSPDSWYDQEASLLKNHPGDFYQMANGHVGLLHPGKPLSPEASVDIARMNGLIG